MYLFEVILVDNSSVFFQLFLRDADQADAWIATKQAFLQAEESSDSLDTVETLLKNQLNFEKSLTAYEEKIKTLQQTADQLIRQEHVDSDLIKKRCEEVLENWRRLKKLATAKIGDLGESRKLFQFLRDAEEVILICIQFGWRRSYSYKFHGGNSLQKCKLDLYLKRFPS